MKRVLTLGSLLAYGLCTTTAAAQETPPQPLRLEEFLASVDRTFPLLKAAEVEKAIAEADILSAEGGFDVLWKSRATASPVGYYNALRIDSTVEKPTGLWGTSAFVGWRLGSGEFPVYDEKQETLEYGEIRAGVNVPLWRNGPIDRRRSSLERAEIGQEIAALTVVERSIEVRRAATHRFWTWIAAGTRLKLAEELLTNVTERDKGLAARVESGDLAPVERTDNARAIEQRKNQVAQARRAVEHSAIELALFYRDETGKPTRLPDERMPTGLPEPVAASPTLASDLRVATRTRPESVKLARLRDQQLVEKDYSKNQLAPGIDLQVAGSQDLGRAKPDRPDLAPAVLEVSVLLEIPLQNRTMRGRAEAASAAAARLNHQKEFAEDRIEADVRDAHSAIGRSLDRLAAARREVALARDLERGERTRFEEGDSHLLVVNLREQQTAEAKLREIDALFDYHRASADLIAARGN